MCSISGTGDLCSCLHRRTRLALAPVPQIFHPALRASDKCPFRSLQYRSSIAFSAASGKGNRYCDDSCSHAAKNRLYYAEELCARERGCCLHDREAVLDCLPVDLV